MFDVQFCISYSLERPSALKPAAAKLEQRTMQLSIAALLWISSLLPKVVTGICYCPYVCENCGWPNVGKAEYGRVLCNDAESQSECQKANWEIADMQNSLGALVSHLLE
jgi:hypothetical protein